MLAGDAVKPETPSYIESDPPLGLGLPFMPSAVSAGYLACPRLPELFPVSFPGVKTSRDDFLVDVDREALRDRLTLYFDPAIGHEEMRRRFPSVMTSTARFKAEEVRDTLRKRGFLKENMVCYCYRPFDIRWLYWEPETKLLDEKRIEYFPHVFEWNLWLSAGQRNRKEDFYQPQYLALLADHHIVESNTGLFPLFLREAPDAPSPPGLDFGPHPEAVGWSKGPQSGPLPTHARDRANGGHQKDDAHPTKTHPNLSPAASTYLESLGAAPEDLFFHALAVMHAPAYRGENAGALRQDWPRIPLPSSKDLLVSSAALGREVAALLDTEREVPGVTSGALLPEFKTIGILSVRQAQAGATVPPRDSSGPASFSAGAPVPQGDSSGPASFGAPGASPGAEVDLSVTAGWGHGGKGGVTMPGKGLLKRRPFTVSVLAALGDAAARLGGAALDIHLNDTTFFANIPEAVWDYTLGGYPVLKKWLSYREQALLGRPLHDDEARHFMHAARRIAALILLQTKLDANHRDVKQNLWQWQKNETEI